MDIRCGQRLRVREKLLEGIGWTLTQHTGKGHHNAIAFDALQDSSALLPGMASGDDNHVVAQDVRRRNEGARGVRDVDGDPIALRSGVPQFREP